MSLYNSIRKHVQKIMLGSEVKAMDFFGMGIGEIILILLVALIIWGPGRIPEIARTLGRWTQTLKRASYDLTSSMTRELNLEEKERPSQSKAEGKDKTDESQDEASKESSTAEMTHPKE